MQLEASHDGGSGGGTGSTRKRKGRSKAMVKAARRRAEAAKANEGTDGADFHPRPRRTATTFEKYYGMQNFVKEDEWSLFMAALRRPLPITIRMNAMKHRSGDVAACIDGAHEILYPTKSGSFGIPTDNSGNPLPLPRKLMWCNGWQMPCDKATAKYGTSPYMRQLQRWLAENSSTGLLTRQEVVSMIPAALLGIKPWHRCLDLCASPGSKTTQLLEGVYSQDTSSTKPSAGTTDAAETSRQVSSNGEGPGGWAATSSGVVVANDFSPARAYLLVRRCAALGLATSRLMIAAHNAQRFPNTQPPMTASTAAATKVQQQGPSGTRYPEGQYDRVLCDVPCSGDGTLRKNPESWSTWGPDYGSSLHILQLRIALRGAALLKTGGLLAYSTCSFNPVEDEAVVTELLRRCGGALELVDTTAMLPTLRRRPGIFSWTVMDDDGNVFPTYESSQAPEIPEPRRKMYQPSMWPSSNPQAPGRPPLNRCLRLLPHLQDTGGFFVALLRKTGPIPGPPPPQGSQGDQEAPPMETDEGEKAAGGAAVHHHHPGDEPCSEPLSGNAAIEAMGHSAAQAHVKVDPKHVKELEGMFGLKGAAWKEISKRLFWRAGGGQHRSVCYVSEGLSEEFLNAPGSARMKQVLVGCKLFQWESMKGRHMLRITPEGVELLLPHATRRVATLCQDGMVALLKKVNKPLRVSQVSKEAEKAAKKMGPGPCVWQHITDSGAVLSVPGEVLIQEEEDEEAMVASRFPFVRGREHAPKAAAAMILRKINQLKQRQ